MTGRETLFDTLLKEFQTKVMKTHGFGINGPKPVDFVKFAKQWLADNGYEIELRRTASVEDITSGVNQSYSRTIQTLTRL